MSKTNCLLPSKGFCLNLRVRTVKSLIAANAPVLELVRQGDSVSQADLGRRGL